MQDKVDSIGGAALMEMRLTFTNVSDGTYDHAEVAITSPTLNAALNAANAREESAHLMGRLMDACKDLAWGHSY